MRSGSHSSALANAAQRSLGFLADTLNDGAVLGESVAGIHRRPLASKRLGLARARVHQLLFLVGEDRLESRCSNGVKHLKQVRAAKRAAVALLHLFGEGLEQKLLEIVHRVVGLAC